MSAEMLAKMEAKLARLEAEFDALFSEAPWVGHGGTPLVDNSAGRAARGAADRHTERMRGKRRAIEEQKEKIARYRHRDAVRTVPTKTSDRWLAKNPIHPGLLNLAEQGLVRQWPRNPEYFFIVNLERVALITVEGTVCRAARFAPKTDAERDVSKALMERARAYIAPEARR